MKRLGTALRGGRELSSPAITWKTVKRVGTRPNGRFAVSVSPSRTTSYRLATPAAAGAAVTVKIP